ncbi:CHAT domain-containing protein [Frankia sp. QA3]|uniref:CHAT domain-containing protein n=1 Tax=Frankia sp. QA3 TaxID=710111 RepID=UPI000269C764|nr:CHAT domain-containing protein [Frankia sp. QA3]EIV93625.1 hypothetical protein FraQA3DRAFT_3336 [Frankia sp. QA3]
MRDGHGRVDPGRGLVRIPRVLVDVEDRGDGWTVRVRGAGITAGYGMAAVLVTDVDGLPRRVPAGRTDPPGPPAEPAAAAAPDPLPGPGLVPGAQLAAEPWSGPRSPHPGFWHGRGAGLRPGAHQDRPPGQFHHPSQIYRSGDRMPPPRPEPGVSPSFGPGGTDPELAAVCAGDPDAICGLLARIAGRDLRDGDAELYGRWLFECLLAPVWQRLLAAPAVRAAQGVELALRWPADDVALAGLVWEAMHDGEAPLAGHRRVLVAVTRVVPAATPAPATIRRVPRVLFVSGAALDDAVIRPGAMFMGLVRTFEAEGLCVSRAMTNATLADLGEACALFAPDIVHLVAHGDVEENRAVLRVADPGEPDGFRHVDGETLALALRGPAGMPAAVILSACGSARPGGADAGGPGAAWGEWAGAGGGTGVGTGGRPAGNADAPADASRAAGRSLAAELALRGVPIVVAMSGEVSEQASRMFTRRFVRAVQQGASVVDAAAAGRRAALLRGDPPSRYLDWAMPTLVLAENVPPDLRVVDPAPVLGLRRAAEILGLRRAPVFIGHDTVLAATDALAAPAAETCPGFVAAVAEGPISGLGGSRLLREVGLRLLRTGHLPLLVGPFGDGAAPPDLRAVVSQILEKAIEIAEVLRIDPPPLTVLDADPGLRLAATVSPQALRGVGAEDRFDLLGDAVAEFAAGTAPLRGPGLRHRLARDLTALADAAVAAGEPFGAATRVVVLGDEVHRWVGGLRPLLAMIRRDGLGSPDRPIPVVVTASLLEDEGVFLKQFRDRQAGQPGFVFPELARMSRASAILGYQWVLLHPWQAEYPFVYTAARNASRVKIEESLAHLNGIPTAVRKDLYLLAEILTTLETFVAADDEGAMRAYEEQFR